MSKGSTKKSKVPSIESLAALANIALTENETKRFQPQIMEVLDYFEMVEDLESSTNSEIEDSKQLGETRDDAHHDFPSSKIMDLAKSKKGKFVKGPRIA